MRHAKSSWEHVTVADRDRPLEPRGERDAAKMARRWASRHAKPDLVVSSPALRALATARIVAEGLDYKRKDIVVDDRLYAATADALLEVVEGLDDKLESAMLVGHNPGLTDLARHFSGEIKHMPTCALAAFTLDAKTWSGIGEARPARTALDSPKQPS
ncbi:MAG: SixA phosphatase family protein [Caldimonas sp.]